MEGEQQRDALDILIVEDSEDDALLIANAMRKGGFEPFCRRVENATDMRRALSDRHWQLILADHRLPAFSAMEAFSIYRQNGRDCPFIIVSGQIGEEAAVAAMKAGVHDYVDKSKLARLGPAVRRALVEVKTQADKEQIERELHAANAELRRHRDELEAALAEKTVLLQEIHHRVKNNLAVIASLLSMRAQTTESEDARAALKESHDRVHSMALIHEQLYRSSKMDRVNFSDYVQSLTHEMHSTFVGTKEQIAIKLRIEPIELEIGQAVPCALILNELISNAFKYAFPAGRRGEIQVLFRKSDAGTLELRVEDDGVGSPANLLDERSRKTFGLQIVSILTKQLGGSLELQPAKGTSIVLRFPASK
jgi:two-component sensor histidine kinase/CheY-like chemotaxis protein